MDRFTRTFQATPKELDAMMRWSREVLDKSALSEKESKRCELAIEEALINISQYAYPHFSGIVEVVCEIDHHHGAIHFTFKDQGIPFNPLKHDYEPDLQAPIAAREIGGLGIHFIVQTMDNVSYRREGDSNILVLTKSYSIEN